MDTIIEKIITLLKQQNKTQKNLTDFLGITQNAFTDWKSGRIKSYTKHLPKIAEFLGVTVDYLLGKSDVPNSQSPQEPAIPENSVTFHFNGKISKKRLTKEQATLIQAMLDAIPDTPLDD